MESNGSLLSPTMLRSPRLIIFPFFPTSIKPHCPFIAAHKTPCFDGEIDKKKGTPDRMRSDSVLHFPSFVPCAVCSAWGMCGSALKFDQRVGDALKSTYSGEPKFLLTTAGLPLSR